MRQPGWRLHPKKPGGPGKLPAQEDRQAHRVVDSKVLKLKIAEQAGRSGWPQVEVSHCRKAINPGTVLTLLWLCCWEGAVGGLGLVQVPPPNTLLRNAARSAPASPLFLREDEIRRGIELLYFGYTSMVRGADAILDRDQ